MPASPETFAYPVSGLGWGFFIMPEQERIHEGTLPLRDPMPDLGELHLRHPGLTANLCRSYAEAASVCLSRHHASPIELTVTNGLSTGRREVVWTSPDDRVKRAWANRDEATRDGAYALSLAGVELDYGLVAIARADTGTGADYYVAPPGEHDDLENALRLEVSGIDEGGEPSIRSRLQQKTMQVRNGLGSGPALVAVAGFAARRIAMIEVEDLR